MSEEAPQPEKAPNDLAKDWLYKLEALTRVKNFVEAAAMFHKNCVYFGLEDDRRIVDFAETWKIQRKLSFDMNQVKIIPSGDLIMVAAPWVATSVIEGAPFKQGRITVGLMAFSNGKLLAVHMHNSYQPQAK